MSKKLAENLNIYEKEIEKLKNEIVKRFSPERIILFGSCAEGEENLESDIDLCIIINTENKREMKMKIYEIEHDIPIDVVVYTPEEWEEHVQHKQSFAYLINTKGVVLYDRGERRRLTQRSKSSPLFFALF
jgi:predicted nucleotidyltransferase